MSFDRKKFRYYYWLTLEFSRKHFKMILLSFFLSLFVILSIVSFSTYLDALLPSRRQVIGIVGRYGYEQLPDSILQKLSHGLVSVDEKGNVRPAVASKWEIKNKGAEFFFTITPGLVWDDGTHFTAKDLRYNFKDVSVTAVSDESVIFKLKKPLPIFPTYLTKPIIRYPLHGVAGDYKIGRVRTSQGYVSELILNPLKKDLLPITYRFYETESDMVSSYQAGEINEMNVSRKSTAESFRKWKNSTVLESIDYSTVMSLFFNLKKKTFEDKELRDAISQSISRVNLTQYGESADSPIPPTSWAYNSGLKKQTHDPESASKIIGKSPLASESAALKLYTFYDNLSAANSIQKDLKETGVTVDILLSNTDFNDYDLLLALWRPPADPDQYFFWHSTQTSGGNITGFKSVKIDKLLEDGRSTLSAKSRGDIYQQFQKVFADEQPAIFLYYPTQYTIKRK